MNWDDALCAGSAYECAYDIYLFLPVLKNSLILACLTAPSLSFSLAVRYHSVTGDPLLPSAFNRAGVVGIGARTGEADCDKREQYIIQNKTRQ